MATLDDFPELKLLFLRLQAEKSDLLSSTQRLRRQYDDLRIEMGKLKERAGTIMAEIKRIENPRRAEIDNELAAIARATGGRIMSRGE